MAVCKCKMCNTPIEVEPGKETVTCPNCGTINAVKRNVDGGVDVEVSRDPIFIKVGKGSKIFEIILWVCGIIPGLIFTIAKIRAGKELSQVEQKINQAASQVDNYMEQRVMILQNCARILDKSINLDKETFSNIAKYRSQGAGAFSDTQAALDNLSKIVNATMENYPDLKAHAELKDAMQQNSYTQREITAAREQYNDVVFQWNRMLFEWPAKQIVAAKRHYCTKIPFAASSEIKEQARGIFF